MGISEFAVHNVLRTYTRQERIGRFHRPRAEAAPARSPDLVTLSATARKVQWLGQFAAELVDARHPGLEPDERSARIRSAVDDLARRHGEALRDGALPPEDLEAQLRGLYLP